jgi:hypothetical protein
MMSDAYVLNVQQNHFNKVSRAKTERRKERYLSISPNLGALASLRELQFFPRFSSSEISNIFG